MYKKTAFVVTIGSLVFFLFHPDRHAKYYSYLNASYIYDELVQSVNKNENEKFICKDYFYKELIKNNKQYNVEYMLNNVTLHPVLPGGEYVPLGCKTRFKSAIIVPYRNREKHLKIFLNYINRYMQIQKIHYRVFVIEQMDTQPFNRGKLLNIGAQEALKSNFSCLFLHDVDLLPLNGGHLYACSKFPRHLASGMDTLRYHLPYLGFTGGVFSISAEHYLKINGMSNRFNGWGGEDDDLYMRILSSNLTVCRFPPSYNMYQMLQHKKAEPSDNRWNELKNSVFKQKVDGINSMTNTYKIIKKESYTHIMV